MRIRVPTRTVFTIGLAWAVLGTCSYYLFTMRRRIVTSNRSAAFDIDSGDVERSAEPQVLIPVADHFYFLNNGPAAAPLYARAEKLFSKRGDARNELHARVGGRGLGRQGRSPADVILKQKLGKILGKANQARSDRKG